MTIKMLRRNRNKALQKQRKKTMIILGETESREGLSQEKQNVEKDFQTRKESWKLLLYQKQKVGNEYNTRKRMQRRIIISGKKVGNEYPIRNRKQRRIFTT